MVRILPTSAALAWLAALVGSASAAPEAPEPVRVIVVVVLASSGDGAIDPKLADLAAEVQKREPELTQYTLAASLQKSIHVGDFHEFSLPEKQKLKVTVERPRGPDGKICLTIEPPGTGEITYSCSCSKFVPVVTPYRTKAGERLILVVMAKPCPDAGK